MPTTSLPTTTPVVDAISRIHFSGNVLPHTWFQEIRLLGGHPDSIGCILLSEIVYWYRSKEVVDEESGRLIGRHKRFRADKLQRSSQAFAAKFGYTKRQVIDALNRLEEGGYITKELRTIKTDDGTTMVNVCFVEPVVTKIEAITFPDTTETQGDDEADSVDPLRLNADPLRSTADPPTLERTLQETTTRDYDKGTTNVGDVAAAPTEALAKKKARKEPNPDGSYGDPDVTAVCAYFKEKLGRTRIDKSDKWNRIMASNLLRGEPDGLTGVKRLIDRLAQDDFWPPNITSLHDLYDKREKITQRGLAREASQQATRTAVTVDEQGIIRGQGFIDISNITASGN